MTEQHTPALEHAIAKVIATSLHPNTSGNVTDSDLQLAHDILNSPDLAILKRALHGWAEYAGRHDHVGPAHALRYWLHIPEHASEHDSERPACLSEAVIEWVAGKTGQVEQPANFTLTVTETNDEWDNRYGVTLHCDEGTIVFAHGDLSHIEAAARANEIAAGLRCPLIVHPW